jgi:hypothetical protein
LEGYLASVEAAQEAIYLEANVAASDVPVDAFLLIAGVWRLWTHVDSQYWIVVNSLSIAEGHGVGRIRAGGFAYSSSSEEVQELREVRHALMQWLDQNELGFVRTSHGLVPLLHQLQEYGVDGDRR